MKLTSHSAILDITRGRKALERIVTIGKEAAALVGERRIRRSIPVTIHGFIDDIGNDDGTSTEFEVAVTKVEVTL